jgi:hypothetical protein
MYCCAGYFGDIQSFKIFFQSESVTGMLNFPRPSKEELELSAKYAKRSGFGKDNKNVVDETYRKAF